MNKPELKDFDYDGADMADWYKGYSEALENYTEHLESTNKQLIEALVDSKKAIESLPSNALGIAGTGEGTRWYVRDELLSQIKTALRDAGVEGFKTISTNGRLS